MPTVSKTFNFSVGTDQLADAGNAAGITVTSIADPATKFAMTAKAATQTEFARRATTGQTWESWGVPTGSVVTSVRITSWSEQVFANTKLSSHSIKVRLINSGNTSIVASDLVSYTPATTTYPYNTWGPEASQTINSGNQDSTTDVRLEMEYTCTTTGGGGGASVDYRMGNITLEITYSTAPTVNNKVYIIS